MVNISEIAKKWSSVFAAIILLFISFISIGIRVFSVIRYESIIHEFDPWFNYRTTQFLVKEGIYELWNWFDHESWYPLGRVVGGTVYPGLMSTSAFIYWIFQKLAFPVEIRNVCVFIAPVFSSFTSISAYYMTKECTGRSEAGLFSALFMSLVPSYTSRSVAGSYDNEAVSIFALLLTFQLYIKSVNTGSLFYSGLSSLAYFYMVASWGGYAFIINIIPIFNVYLFLADRWTTRAHVAYTTFYIMGTFLAMQIPFVGFQAIHSSEHLASHVVFIFLQSYAFTVFLKKYFPPQGFKIVQRILIQVLLAILLSAVFYLSFTGKSRWSGRSLTLLDPTYAKKYIPIIASVSEHQATTWSNFFFDLQFLLVLAPVGLYYCFKKSTDGCIFVAIYVVLSVYFASVMIRLLLVMAPAVCIAAGIGASNLIRYFTKSLRYLNTQGKAPFEVSLLGIITIFFICSLFVFHGTIIGAEVYSNPSVIISSKNQNGQKQLIDDFREAYKWLNENTKQDAKILSWWDYGYQITGMSNRTVLVDNNTWNNTHIATVGLALASNEDEAFEICKKLDVDYVLIIFGGASSYSGDDINKFYWMIKITGGVYPHVREESYQGQSYFSIDSKASENMLNSLMYRLSFYRFDQKMTTQGRYGFDTVRNTDIGLKGFKLKHFEEAYTSENWIVRIYRVKDRQNRAQISMESAAGVINKDEKQRKFQNHKYFNKIT